MKAALSHGGWLVALVVLVGALVFATYARPAAPVIDPIIDAVRSPESFNCPPNWTKTDDRAPDAEAKVKTRTCTSPDRRYVITARENQAPVGLDTLTKLFMSPEELDAVLR